MPHLLCTHRQLNVPAWPDTENDQFGQLISFISGYYVSDHAEVQKVSPDDERWYIEVRRHLGGLELVSCHSCYVNTVLVLIISCHRSRLICRECVAMVTYEVRTDASHMKAFHTACRLLDVVSLSKSKNTDFRDIRYESVDRRQFQSFCRSMFIPLWFKGSMDDLHFGFNGLVLNPE
ncbi:hypothetical protein T12_16230 [Trichinella patagoniensis]|uniref:Uncharacterized protein n=1 Tax=Trichinella patagoniensis TaxID=990121 RepID=A0A0V0ZHL8_9BILA|nr:hypothetical protein T12_16230 [Trichinella patagoniensis]